MSDTKLLDALPQTPEVRAAKATTELAQDLWEQHEPLMMGLLHITGLKPQTIEEAIQVGFVSGASAALTWYRLTSKEVTAGK